ncbi:tripartite motif-containing protein 2-like [Branchiostoma floridae]|uniref:RING-type E3 ubiquitin transferase n=1 Tax=Branchiostoma floridae TaxID=7739 RepID=A0A9J7L827_BRAFL|nr:tripartite motif-containing protein 2-like [Branchiostoma floridae]
MASKLASDFGEQFLTCQVCMLHFRDPRVLPCLHTFCRECLQEWATKQQPLECPTCRTQVSLPDKGVDGLRTNFYVNNLLDFAAVKKEAGPGVPCQVCEGGRDQTKLWCTDCAMLLCESCTAIHRKVPVTSQHELVPQEGTEGREGPDRPQRKRHCHKHKSQELVFYCESCNVLVCTACTVIDHRPGKDHNPVEISTVAQRGRETLKGLLEDIVPRMKEMQASSKEVEKKMSNLNPAKEAATDQAKAYFHQLADLLQKRESEILRQIDDQCRADGKALQTQKEAIEFELAGLTSAQTFCQQAVERGSDVHILEVGNQVQTRVETLLAKQQDLESDWSEFQFVENTTVKDFNDEVWTFGGLKTDVDVSKCGVVVKPAVQGFHCSASLTTVNRAGHACVTHSRAVTTNMKDPSGTGVPTKLQMGSEGRWEISYVPKVTGNHSLEVKVNSQEVAGSPFDVTVQDKGTPVLTIGRKGGGVGDLDGPLDVAVDTDGTIVVVEQGNRRVQMFHADTGGCLGGFPVSGEGPYGLGLDSEGAILVTSLGEDCAIRRYSKQGALLNSVQPDCLCPSGAAVLQDGRMVVSDSAQGSCLLLEHDGSLIRDIGSGHLQFPSSIAVDESRGVIYVTDRFAHKIFAFDLEGNLTLSFGRQGQGDGEFQSPAGVALDPAGNVIVGNAGDGRVQVFAPDGSFVRNVATVTGKSARGVAVTPEGLCVAVACYKGHCVELYRYM